MDVMEVSLDGCRGRAVRIRGEAIRLKAKLLQIRRTVNTVDYAIGGPVKQFVDWIIK